MPEHQQTQQSKESKPTFQKQAALRSSTHVNPASIIQRARINPKSLTVADVLQLQRTIGNRAVGRLLSEIRNPSKVQQIPIQRQKLEEEICPSCVQRQETLEEEEPLQGVFESKLEQATCASCIQRKELEEEELLQTKRENNTGMPDNLKAGVESLSGIDMSDVRVHYNSSKPAEVGALAYTQGTNIHVAPGQERHLPHEAWHVVQQAQGRVKPTNQIKVISNQRVNRKAINVDKHLEREADVLGARFQADPVQSLSGRGQTPSPLTAGNILAEVVQGLFKKVAQSSLVGSKLEGKIVYIDEETKEIYFFQVSSQDGRKIFLYNQSYIVVIDSEGNLLEKNPVTSKMEVDDPPQLALSMLQGDLMYNPSGAASEGLREEGINPSKLITDLSSQIVLNPISQGELSGSSSGILEYKYSPNKIWVTSIQIGDKDRPETRFEDQESHTVAWTLVRNGLMGLAGQNLMDFLNYLENEFREIEPFVKSMEGKDLLAALTGFNVLKTMHSGSLPIDIWQKLTSELLVQYLQIYQLSSSATYKRGKALGHGESHAMKRLTQDEEMIRANKSPREASKVSLDAAKMLDVQFVLGSLGMKEYAFAVIHWLKMLQQKFPLLMDRYQDQILTPIVNKQVANNFKDDLGIPRSTSFTVKDLLDNFGYVIGAPKVKQVKKLERIDIMKAVAKKLNTNFVANIGIVPLAQGIPQNRQINDTTTIQDMVYPYSYLSIGHIQISDYDRPKTKFLKDQKSHTVPWTLARNMIKSFKGKSLQELLVYLFERFQELKIDIKIAEGISIAQEGMDTICLYADKMLPIDYWQAISSELVRKYFIAYQVADSTTYINPKEAERALGHGEGSNMEVLRRNEYAISSFGGIIDFEDRILDAIYGMFDAQVTKTLSEAGIKQAFHGMLHKLQLTFPHVSEYFLDKASTKMKEKKIGQEGRTLKDVMEDDSIGIDRSGFFSLKLFDPFHRDEYQFGPDALVDESGSIKPAAMPYFLSAYRRDIVNSIAFLTEGEGYLAAERLGITVQVFEGRLPEGYSRVENPGGGNCLLHALVQAYAANQGRQIPPKGATVEETQYLRRHIAENIGDDVVKPLVTTAVLGWVLGVPEPGLGPEMRALLAHPSITVARKLQLTKGSSGIGNISSSAVPSKFQPNKKEGTQQAQEQQAVATFGSGIHLPNIALLHVGVHYVLILKPK